MVEPLLILPGLVVAFLGYYGTKSNVLRIKEVRGLAAAEAKDVRQVRPDSGFVEIEGTAQPGEGETLAAPIANTDALLRVSKLQRWHSSSHDDPGSYHTKDRAVASVPFDVDDGTGDARIQVPEVDTRYSLLLPGLEARTTSLLVDSEQTELPGSRIPDEIRERFDEEIEPDRNYRVWEGAIAPGQMVYVAGFTERVPAGVDTNVAIGGGDDPDRMVIADKPESEIESGNLRFAILGLVLSLLFLLAGLGLAGLGMIA